MRALLAVALLALLGLAAPQFASRVGDTLHACLAVCAKPAARTPGPLRIATLNVFHGFPGFEHLRARLDLVARELSRLDVDVALLQELPWTEATGPAIEHLAAATGYNYVYVRANGNFPVIGFEEGVGMLSRFPLADARFTELEPRAGVFEHRAALAATALTPAGRVRLVTAHLAHGGGGEVNAAQLDAVLDFAAPDGDDLAVVLAGDFNARASTPHISALGTAWLDAFRSVSPAPGLTCCRRGERLGEPRAGKLFARLDYVFLRAGGDRAWTVKRASTILDRPYRRGRGLLWASNHAGVLVEAELARPAPTSLPAGRLDPARERSGAAVHSRSAQSRTRRSASSRWTP